jgi:hypothetical protein
MSEEKKDFVIKDRRIFSEDRPEQEDDSKQEVPEEASAKAPEDKEKSDQTDSAQDREEDIRLPEINFPTFIFSLNSSALVHLGIIEDPASGQKSKNLAMAKQTIDILGMIEEKTQGNLSTDEASMLKHILYELRMIYVKEKG